MGYYDYDNDGVGAFPDLRSLRRPSMGANLPSLSPGPQGLPQRPSFQGIPEGLMIPGSATPINAFGSAGQNNRIVQGFPIQQWTDASVSASATVKARPQQALRPERLVVAVALSTGMAGTSVTISSIKIGKDEMLPSSDPIAVEAFANNAVGSALLLDPATYGYEITIVYNTSALPAAASGDTVTVTTAMFAEAVNV